MKLFRFLFSILILSSVVIACVDEYDEPTDYSTFDGAFTLHKVEKKINGALVDVTQEELGGDSVTIIKSVFIQIRDSLLMTYKNGMRDSSQLYSFYIVDETLRDIYVNPVKKDTVEVVPETPRTNVKPGYSYYGTYRFSTDSLYIEKYPVQTSSNTEIVLRNNPILERRVYSRPKEQIIKN